mgnify:CR=1 FL=1
MVLVYKPRQTRQRHLHVEIRYSDTNSGGAEHSVRVRMRNLCPLPTLRYLKKNSAIGPLLSVPDTRPTTRVSVRAITDMPQYFKR